MDRRRFLAALAASAATAALAEGAEAKPAEHAYADGGLATPCGIFCGFCRLYMNGKCKGCGTGEQPNKPGSRDCPMYQCCRLKKKLRFCTECEEFPCEPLRKSKALDVSWLDTLAKEPLPGKAAKTPDMLAPCGIDCSKCDILARGDCAGCRADRTKQWSGDCSIRACCTDTKHLTYCSDCDQFPCQKLKDWAAAWPHHGEALKRLEGRRGKG